MSRVSPEPTDPAIPVVSPWYRLPMYAAAVYCVVVLAISIAALLMPLR